MWILSFRVFHVGGTRRRDLRQNHRILLWRYQTFTGKHSSSLLKLHKGRKVYILYKDSLQTFLVFTVCDIVSVVWNSALCVHCTKMYFIFNRNFKNPFHNRTWKRVVFWWVLYLGCYNFIEKAPLYFIFCHPRTRPRIIFHLSRWFQVIAIKTNQTENHFIENILWYTVVPSSIIVTCYVVMCC